MEWLRQGATQKEIEAMKRGLRERYSKGADSRVIVLGDSEHITHTHIHNDGTYVDVQEMGFGNAARLTPKRREKKQGQDIQRTKWVRNEEGEIVSVDLKVLRKFKAPEPPDNMLCPEHDNATMVYIAERDTFICPVEGCYVAARKRITLADDYARTPDGEQRAVDSVYRGAMELVKDANGKPYLHLTNIGALIDMEEFMRAAGGVAGTTPDPKG